MKFAAYLNDHAVPEWKSQYLDYKQGKKKLKKINTSPFLASLKNSVAQTPGSKQFNNNITPQGLPIKGLKSAKTFPSASTKNHANDHYTPGGFESVATEGNKSQNRRSSLVSFQLPPPAIGNSPAIPHKDNHKDTDIPSESVSPQTNDRTPLLTPKQYPTPVQLHESNRTSPMQGYTLSRRKSRIGSFVNSIRGVTSSLNSTPAEGSSIHELTSYAEFSKNEFISWVDDELLKIETFYQEREKHDVERFLVLQNQTVQLREQSALVKQKLKALLEAKNENHAKAHPAKIRGEEALTHRFVDELEFLKEETKKTISQINKFELPSLPSLSWLVGNERQKEYYDEGYYSEESEAEDEQNTVGDLRTSEDDEDEVGSSAASVNHVHNRSHRKQQDPRFNKRDYSKQQNPQQTYSVPYYIARRQLKTALLELYRSLELLKSYKMLNRTAFRKMMKKFDKTTKSSMLNSYMEKVDASYFSKSEVVDELISKIEDVYSATFEKGNRKVAIAKLRTNEVVKTFYTTFFTSGLFLGISLPLFILALYKGLHDTLRGILPEGRFLLQIWAGFFIVTLMALLFGVNCYIWSRYKINYKFIFEFDGRTSLDFKQFLLMPSFSMFLLGFFGWFSFENFWPTQLPGRYWPWFYAGIVLLTMLCPFEIFFYHSRRWILTTIWRLIFSGFYPVEFRDFFIGDIFCSLTYSLSNISFFICLYATHWDGTLTGGDTKCGSSSSRLMGFLASLPSVWRLMQCIRRYADTGDWFPHLANCLKYAISTIYYVLLSVYRIDRSLQNRAVFIVFASVNSIYSSIWDIFMDWSLMQAGSEHLFLRDDLIFKKSWYYYVAIVFDVVMRFQWIFYAFFKRQIQQSAATSFCIALAEVLRRFVWIFFRMENEHCTNVHLFRASRDTPLPYPVNKKVVSQKFGEYLTRIKPIQSSTPLQVSTRPEDEERVVGLRPRKASTVADLSDPNIPAPLTRRATMIPQGIEKFSQMLNKAHIKDFQRRKVKPETSFLGENSDDEDGHDTDDDEDDDEDVVEAIADQERQNYAEGGK